MTKHEEQKHKASPVARQGRPVASIPSRTSAARIARVAVNTRPLPSSTQTNGETSLSEESSTANPSSQPSPAFRQIRRRQLLIGGAGLAATALALGGWFWAQEPHNTSSVVQTKPTGDQLVVRWNEATLQAIRILQPPMPVAARALAIVHTCMFDAWAAYDPVALGTRFGASLRRSSDEWTQANKCQAISYAAYRALVDLFPSEQNHFYQIMTSLRYNPSNASKDLSTPVGIGNLAAQAVLDFRHNDGANQLGNLSPNAYSDYTHYQPVNTKEIIKDPNRWQPLRVANNRPGLKDQLFDCAQWGNVTPFALASAIQFVPRPGPAKYPEDLYTTQAQQIVGYSTNLTDEQKMIAEYWADGPNHEEPAGHWSLFAQFISRRDNYTLDQNVKLFFALANATLDASIACWAAKRAYDSASPATAIHYLYKDKQIRAWAGAGKGVQMMAGQYWQPYQPLASLVSAPEYCSEQSAFSAASAAILRNFTGSDRLGMSYVRPAGSSVVESNVPATSITLSWPTFTQAAEQAGLAGRYGGAHFTQSDLDGRVLGNQVGTQVWLKAQRYITGHATT